MKAYKIVFRLDFPPIFDFIDTKGQLIKFVIEKLSDTEIKTTTTNLNLISFSGVLNKPECSFEMTYEMTAFSGSLEFKEGQTQEMINRLKLFELLDEVFEKSYLKTLVKIERFGMRYICLDSIDDKDFSSILNYFSRFTSGFSDCLQNNNLPAVSDLGLVLESINSKTNSYRLAFGPYKQNERQKYFNSVPNFGDGIIADFDLWHSKLNVPGFRLTNYIANNNKLVFSGLNSISKKIRNDLK